MWWINPHPLMLIILQLDDALSHNLIVQWYSIYNGIQEDHMSKNQL